MNKLLVYGLEVVVLNSMLSIVRNLITVRMVRLLIEVLIVISWQFFLLSLVGILVFRHQFLLYMYAFAILLMALFLEWFVHTRRNHKKFLLWPRQIENKYLRLGFILAVLFVVVYKCYCLAYCESSERYLCNHISRLTSPSEEKSMLGTCPNWPSHDGGLKLKMAHVRYMEMVAGRGRDCNTSIAGAFYRQDGGQGFKLRFVVRRRDSSCGEWRDVGSGHVSGVLNLREKRCEIKENVSDIKGISIDSGIGETGGWINSGKDYLVIKISCLGCKDEFRYNIDNNASKLDC